ncbi:Carnosine N-methyltransferase [Pseudolycoriella hygida]|uniref:carnosine N-methyltransferase n=1 Tax=Pseudolycoriella hygida TaxID=35572 RepID=A0A9Q0RXM7_9DIPT|nr:Carnosine N-methyltransferase [Pseudolycoriella hygida]
MNRTNDINYAPCDPEDIEEEQNNFLSILAAFKNYRNYSMGRVTNTEKYLNTLPRQHQQMMSQYRDHLGKIRYCIDENEKVIQRILQDVDKIFQNENQTVVRPDKEQIIRVREMDLDKVLVTLKQFARDWSSDGEEERTQCYKPIIDEVLHQFNPNEVDVSQIKILVPGAGLGRLTYELARRGYYCEGNEFSLFMLIASNFVLNKCVIDNQYTIYPWVHQYVNNAKREDQVKSITFPDVSPTQDPPTGEFHMIAGDFLQVYKEVDYWECVATCFFIDCANNVAEFIQNIYNILKPGGIWINLGPLLYHYSDMHNEGSVEPTYEDLIIIIKSLGFEIIKNQTGVKTKYAQNPRSMQQSEYLSVFFVCRKPLESDETENGFSDDSVNDNV